MEKMWICDLWKYNGVTIYGNSNHTTIYDPGKNFSSGSLAPNADQVRKSQPVENNYEL